MNQRELLERINQTAERGKTKLDLSRRELKSLPPEIGKLTNLRVLDLFNNQLAALPPEIGKLTTLQRLDLSRNPLTALPPEIGRLSALKSLKVMACQLDRLPEELFQLQGLGMLWLDNNPLRAIPPDLAKLSSLKDFSLDRTQIRTLPEALFSLVRLKVLYLNGLDLETLPPQIQALGELRGLYLVNNRFSAFPGVVLGLKYLERLNLSQNQITTLPAEIERLGSIKRLHLAGNRLESYPPTVRALSNLEYLDLSKNRIRELGPEILEGKQDILWQEHSGSDTNGINLFGNPLESPPVEIVKQGREAIRNYFRQIRDQGGVATGREARLLIVGEPKSGKTTLLKKIWNREHPVPDDSQEETLGITVMSRPGFPEAGDSGSSFTTHLWDFGGQNIQYHLHQFFLADRSVYVLMLDDRRECATLDYWFNIIKLLGAGSPVLVVLNRIHKTGVSSFDFPTYQRRYPELAMQCLAVDFSKTDHHFDCLIRQIEEMIRSLPHLREQLPAAWPKVREVLTGEEYRNRKTLDWSEFGAICGRFGVREEADQLTLSGYFHSLGLIQHFQRDSALFNTVFLNPPWLTRAVYTVLSDPAIVEHQGSFTRDWLFARWGNDYSLDQKHKLLQLMQKREFDLCYAYRQEGRECFLAPDLMPNVEPAAAKDWEKTETLSFRYHYPFMPQGLIGRLIVRLSGHLTVGPDGRQRVWKSGAILAANGVEALVRYARTRRNEEIIELHTRLGWKRDRREFLSQIRNELEALHAESFPHLTVEPQVPCRCSTCRGSDQPHVFPFESVLRALDLGKPTLECGISLEAVSVGQLSGEYLSSAQVEEIRRSAEGKGHTFVQNIHIGDKNTTTDHSTQFGDRAAGNINHHSNKEINMGDTYNNSGQAGAFGPNAKAEGNTFQQIQLSSGQPVDFKQLAAELTRLRGHLSRQATTDAEFESVTAITEAKKAAEAGDGNKVFGFLKSTGQWALGVATDIGTNLAAEVIKKSMGL